MNNPKRRMFTIFDILIQGNEWPVSFFLQEVLEKTHLSSEFFNLYLHQNYLEFSAGIDDVVGKECPTEYFQYLNHLQLSSSITV